MADVLLGSIEHRLLVANQVLLDEAAILEREADIFDEMSRRSKSGGWSTHLCTDLETNANDFRRRASQLRRIANFS